MRDLKMLRCEAHGSMAGSRNGAKQSCSSNSSLHCVAEDTAKGRSGVQPAGGAAA